MKTPEQICWKIIQADDISKELEILEQWEKDIRVNQTWRIVITFILAEMATLMIMGAVSWFFNVVEEFK